MSSTDEDDNDGDVDEGDGKNSSIDRGETKLWASDSPGQMPIVGTQGHDNDGSGGTGESIHVDKDEDEDSHDDCSASSDMCILEGNKYHKVSRNFRDFVPRGEGESMPAKSATTGKRTIPVVRETKKANSEPGGNQGTSKYKPVVDFYALKNDDSQESGNTIPVSPTPISNAPSQSKGSYLFTNWTTSTQCHDTTSDTKVTMRRGSIDTGGGGRFGGLAVFGKRFSWTSSNDTSTRTQTKQNDERQSSIAGGFVSFWNTNNNCSGDKHEDGNRAYDFSIRRRSSSNERNRRLSNSFQSIFSVDDQNDGPSKQTPINERLSSLSRSFSNLKSNPSAAGCVGRFKPANARDLGDSGFTTMSGPDQMSGARQRSLSFYESEDLWKEFRREMEINRVTNAVGVKTMFAKFVREKLDSRNNDDETTDKTNTNDCNDGNKTVLPCSMRRNSCFGRYITVNPLSDEVNKKSKTPSANASDVTTPSIDASGSALANLLYASLSTRGKQDLNSSSSSLWSDPDLSFTSRVFRDHGQYQNVIRGDARRMSLNGYDDGEDNSKNEDTDETLGNDEKRPHCCDSDDSEERWGKINKNYDENPILDRSDSSTGSKRGLLDLSWRRGGQLKCERRNSVSNLDLSWRRRRVTMNCGGNPSLSRSYSGNSSGNGQQSFLDLSWTRKDAGIGSCGRRNSIGNVISSWSQGAAPKEEENHTSSNSFVMRRMSRESEDKREDDEGNHGNAAATGSFSFAELSLFEKINLNVKMHSGEEKRVQTNEVIPSQYRRPVLVQPKGSSDLTPPTEVENLRNDKQGVQEMGLPCQGNTTHANEDRASHLASLNGSNHEGQGSPDENNEKGSDIVDDDGQHDDLDHFDCNQSDDCEFYDTDEIDQENDAVVEKTRLVPRRSSLKTGSFTSSAQEYVHNDLGDIGDSKIELLQLLLGGSDNGRSKSNRSSSFQTGSSPVTLANQGLDNTASDIASTDSTVRASNIVNRSHTDKAILESIKCRGGVSIGKETREILSKTEDVDQEQGKKFGRVSHDEISSGSSDMPTRGSKKNSACHEHESNNIGSMRRNSGNQTIPRSSSTPSHSGGVMDNSVKLVSSQQISVQTKFNQGDTVSAQSAHSPRTGKRDHVLSSQEPLQRTNSQKLLSILLGKDDDDADSDDERVKALPRPVSMKYKPRRKHQSQRNSIRRSSDSPSTNDETTSHSFSDKNNSSPSEHCPGTVGTASRTSSESTHGSLLVEWGELYDPNED
ncbi:hypothetical protein ACHAXS_004961 [Conticribra weissflogii]